MTVEDVLSRNPVLEVERKCRSRIVRRRFSPWLPENAPDEWLLSLFPFASVRPLRYLFNDSIESVVSFFSSEPDLTLQGLVDFRRGITRAIETITTPSAIWDEEDSLELKTAEDYVRFDQALHPEYHRYAEHAFNHLIQVPLFVLGSNAGTNYVSQALSNRVRTLRMQPGLRDLTPGFKSVLRNAIAHGSVQFTQFGAQYTDRTRSMELYPDAFARKLDGLVKGAQTLVVSLIIFLLRHWREVKERGVEKLPLGFLYLAALGAATHRDFTVERFVPSQLADGRQQLNIVCGTGQRARAFHQFTCLHLIKGIERLGGPRYDRAFVSIHCGRRVPSSMVINVAYLRRSLREKLPAEELAKVVDGSLLWHDTSNLLRRIANLRLVFRTVWDNHKEEVIVSWRELGLLVASSLYELRAVSNRSGDKLRRIEGKAVLRDGLDANFEDVQGIALHAIRRLRRTRIRASSGLVRETLLRRRPSHVWVTVFRHDDYLRELTGRLSNSEDVLVEAEWKSFWSKSRFNFVPKPDETKGRVRLKYSRLLAGGS